MNSLSKIFDKYAAFEGKVGAYMTKICRKQHSVCAGACCRPEICMESITSLFLRRLRHHGWLTEAGCALPLGRPPVCYQFFCEAIFEDWPTVEFRDALTILAELVNHVGKRARGRKHIVELQESSELKRINFTRFEKQLNEADSAFKWVRAFLGNDPAELIPAPILSKISLPPSDYVY
jgi:hypothetical protein